MSITHSKLDEIVYPDSDGEPMADNNKQFDLIVGTKSGMDAVFEDDPNVYVAGDLLWYPVKGSPKIRMAPDVMIVFGRPKGHRGSYKQWEEGNIAPQVVFEILSPGNTRSEMRNKFSFYERYGVEEYYIYDPDRFYLEGWLRQDKLLVPIEKMQGWVSPHMKVRFELGSAGELVLYGPDGKRFATYLEVIAQRKQAEYAALQAQHKAEQEQHRAAQEQRRAEQEQRRAEQAEQKASQERQRAEQAEQKASQEEQRAEQAEKTTLQERQRAEQAEQATLQERQRAERLAAWIKAQGLEFED